MINILSCQSFFLKILLIGIYCKWLLISIYQLIIRIGNRNAVAIERML